MASKKTKAKEQESGFGRMLAGAVVVGIVFSAGLITGQRLLRAEARAPMVSLSTTRQAPRPADGNTEAKPSLRTTFSFYDHLTNDASATPKPTEEVQVAVEANPAAAKPAPAKPAAAKPAAVEKPAAAVPPAKADPVAAILDEVVDSLAGPAPEAKSELLPARYTLQVSSHPDRESAEREMGRLGTMGVEPNVVVVDVPGKGKLWRVRVGKFHSMDEARDFQGSIKSRRGVAGFVTPL